MSEPKRGSDDLRSRTLRGVSWSALSQVVRQVVSLVVTVVLVRLLTPADFGLVAMVAVLTNFALIYADLGFSAALIQKQEPSSRDLSSIFWLNLGGGLFFTVLLFLGAPAVAGFYGEAQLVPITRALSFTFLIGSLNIVQRTLLQKELDFRSLAIVDLTAIVLAGAAAVVLAALGWGVWALVARALTSSLVTAGMLWKQSGWAPGWGLDRGSVRELSGFGLNVLGTNTLAYWTRNLDNLLIGRVLGSTPLGLYAQAYAIFMLPLNNITQIVGKVMFPALSEIQSDAARVKRIYLRATALIGLFSFPLLIGLFVTSETLVRAVFGGRWEGMIPLLRIFSVLGITGSIMTITGTIYLSQGRADLQFRLGLLFRVNKVLWIIGGVYLGGSVIWVAAALTASSWINMFPTLHFAGGLIGLRIRELLWNLRAPFAIAATMGALVYGLELLVRGWTSTGVLLALQIAVGGLIYSALLHLFRPAPYRELLDILRGKISPHKPVMEPR